MARPASTHPTELELEILKILWRDGPSPVRQVRDALAAGGRKLAYTSVMTVMGIMTKKKYLKRTKIEGSYVYTPRSSEQQTTGGMLKDLLKRAFSGSPAAAVMNLLRTGELDAEELKQLRKAIDAQQKRTGGES